MPFKPPKIRPKFSDLKSILSQSAQTDEALYQTIEILLERLDYIFPTIESGGTPHAPTHQLNGVDPITSLDASVIDSGTIDDARLSANVAVGYGEGLWGPNDISGAGLFLPVTNSKYTTVGDVVLLGFEVTYPATASGLAAKIGGLPFAVGNKAGNMATGFGNVGVVVTGYLRAATTTIELYAMGGGAITNAQMSGKTISMGGHYFI